MPEIELKQQYGNYIGGEYCPPAGGNYLASENPHDLSTVAEIADSTAEDIDRAVRNAAEAQRQWAALSGLERGKILIEVAKRLEREKEFLGALESREMGMPVEIATFAQQGSIDYLHYFGGLAPSCYGEHIQTRPDKHAYTFRQPHGLVGIITPWNVPLNQACRSVSPALAAGNAVVLKPSEYTSISSLYFAQFAVEAGLPPGVLNVVTGRGAGAGEALVNHDGIRKIAFTGSVATGRKVAAMAAEKVLPVSLELGGKSPDIVFADADMTAAVPGVLLGLNANAGQICLAGTRIIVERSIYDRFTSAMTEAMAQIPRGVSGNFANMGPMANRMQFDKVMGFLDRARQDGLKVLTGGDRASGEGLDQGYYVQPTLIEADNDHYLSQTEIFGPVGICMPFDSEDEAVQLANGTPYGLAAGLWTRDLSRAHRVAAQLDAGQIYVNNYLDRSVEVPLAPHKMSGHGVEKGMEALHHYSKVKAVIVQL